MRLRNSSHDPVSQRRIPSLAGGRVRPGIAFGEADEWGYKAVQDKLEMHDLHATIVHLLGLDHARLTDVFGNVVRGILA